MRLLRLGPEQVQKYIEGMEKECAEIKKNAFSLAWYMRGGVSYEDVLNMSIDERSFIGELVKQNLETTKTSQMPFF